MGGTRRHALSARWAVAMRHPRDVMDADRLDEVRSRAEYQLDRVIHDAFFRGVSSGVFVDVGAAGPDRLSMSAMYRDIDGASSL